MLLLGRSQANKGCSWKRGRRAEGFVEGGGLNFESKPGRRAMVILLCGYSRMYLSINICITRISYAHMIFATGGWDGINFEGG